MKANTEEGTCYINVAKTPRDFKKAIEYHELDLKLAKEMGHIAGEGRSYANLGDAYYSLGNFKKAIEYHERHLKIAKELGDRAAEGTSYGNLGNVYYSLGNFRKAIEYHERHLKIAKELGDRAGEGSSFCNLGVAYCNLGDYNKAIEYHERHLKIAKELGDRAGEGSSSCNLGVAYDSLGDYNKAIEYHERHLKIAKEAGDRTGQGKSYANLGNAYHSLGDFRKAIEYHESHQIIVKEVGDRAGEGRSYSNLGNAYYSLGNFKRAIEYHELHLKIAKEVVGDRAGEGRSYGNLGNAYYNLGDFETAIEYHDRHLKIAKEVGDRAGEGKAYGNLGNNYWSLGDFKRAIKYHELNLKIAKEVGDRAGEGRAYCNLGACFESQCSLKKALDCYHSGVRLFNNVRKHLQGKDEWTISYRNVNNVVYTRLWRLILKQGDVVEALFAVEEGRAQALRDLMNSKYETETPHTGDKVTHNTLSWLPSDTVFMAVHESEIIFWIIQNGKDVQLRRKQISDNNSTENASRVLESLIHKAHEKIGVSSSVKCEDRSLDRKSGEHLSKKRDQTIPELTHSDTNPLRRLYDVIISPIKDLINGDELIFVPEGPLCLAPYAAFMDSNSKYLSESFKIRVIPSLTSLKLIRDCLPDYHKKCGALLVGDPCLEQVRYCGLKLEQLPFAKTEVQMIGKILNTVPLTGKEATKAQVLRKLSSVALVHIAAHGRMETGEIALAPNPTRASQILVEEDFLLTMSDVMRVQMRAGLVVLSCCHSGRGEIKAEGVVGIARAFLGAGARSVLVSLWAIDDEATMEFMKSFYLHLAEGRSSIESLNRAMSCLRESEKFSEVKHWASFTLIGDDVTLDLAKGD